MLTILQLIEQFTVFKLTNEIDAAVTRIITLDNDVIPYSTTEEETHHIIGCVIATHNIVNFANNTIGGDHYILRVAMCLLYVA